jgi:hypothetical protein
MIKDTQSYLQMVQRNCETYLNFNLGISKNYYSIDTPDYNTLAGCSFAWTNYFHAGWHSFLFEKNISSAQEFFYICGRMDEYIIKLVNNYPENFSVNTTASGRLMHVNTFTALLSGCNSLIDRRWQLSHKALGKYIFKDYLTVYIQLGIFKSIISKDKSSYNQILSLYRNCKKPDKYLADVSYFKALAIGDISTMEKAIEEIASSKMTAYRQKFDYKDLSKNTTWYAGLMSWDGILYTKFAKMQGFDLQIKSPLVTITQPLIDAPPLEYYDDEFDFLKVQMPNGIMRTREEIEAAGIKIIE